MVFRINILKISNISHIGILPRNQLVSDTSNHDISAYIEIGQYLTPGMRYLIVNI